MLAIHQPRIKVHKPDDLLPFFRKLVQLPQEFFLAADLNKDNVLITARIVTIGVADKAIVHPREVFAPAVAARAAAVVLAHNHPSGALRPSNDDRNVTEQLCKAADVLGIRLIDHIIFTAEGYFSFVEHGLMPE